MFKMQVEEQLNILDRTLLLGTPEFDVLPDVVLLDNRPIRVIGVTPGARLPKLSLEIEKTSENLVGKTITA